MEYDKNVFALRVIELQRRFCFADQKGDIDRKLTKKNSLLRWDFLNIVKNKTIKVKFRTKRKNEYVEMDGIYRYIEYVLTKMSKSATFETNKK